MSDQKNERPAGCNRPGFQDDRYTRIVSAESRRGKGWDPVKAARVRASYLNDRFFAPYPRRSERPSTDPPAPESVEAPSVVAVGDGGCGLQEVFPSLSRPRILSRRVARPGVTR